MASQSVARAALRSGDRAAAGMLRPRRGTVGAKASRYGVASSSGRNCSALRGRTIRIVAFRASRPAKPPSRQRRFVQRFSGSFIRCFPWGIRYCGAFSKSSAFIEADSPFRWYIYTC